MDYIMAENNKTFKEILGFTDNNKINAHDARSIAVYGSSNAFEKIVKDKLQEIYEAVRYKSQRGQTILVYRVRNDETELYQEIARILETEGTYKVIMGPIEAFGDNEIYLHINWL